jgi:hypothetical protein
MFTLSRLELPRRRDPRRLAPSIIYGASDPMGPFNLEGARSPCLAYLKKAGSFGQVRPHLLPASFGQS